MLTAGRGKDMGQLFASPAGFSKVRICTRCENVGINHKHDIVSGSVHKAGCMHQECGPARTSHDYLRHVMLLSLQSFHGLYELLPLALNVCFNLAQLLPV